MTPVQLDLAFPTRRFPDVAPHIEEAFLKFHSNNPAIFDLFKRFANEARDTFKCFGAKAILERLRWEVPLDKTGQFKINNSFASCYARLLIQENPAFKNFFELRSTPGTIEVI